MRYTCRTNTTAIITISAQVKLYLPQREKHLTITPLLDHGLVEMNCNLGLVFNPYINGCDYELPDNCVTYSQFNPPSEYNNKAHESFDVRID